MVELDVQEADLHMKPFNKAVKSSPGAQLTIARPKPLQNMRKKEKAANGKPLSKKISRNYFVS